MINVISVFKRRQTRGRNFVCSATMSTHTQQTACLSQSNIVLWLRAGVAHSAVCFCLTNPNPRLDPCTRQRLWPLVTMSSSFFHVARIYSQISCCRICNNRICNNRIWQEQLSSKNEYCSSACFSSKTTCSEHPNIRFIF